MSKSVLTLIVVAVVVVGGTVIYKADQSMQGEAEQANIIAATPALQESPASTLPGADVGQVSPAASGEVKEFTLTSFYEMVDGKPKPQFSLSEMRVKKGDTVRIKVTNTKGMHDFVIDEFGVAKETPLNQEVAIEFTAGKAGNFVYYCSKPNHRMLGQWGTLVVEE